MLTKTVVVFERLMKTSALAGVAQWIEGGLETKRSQVRAYAWVAGQVPCGGQVRSNHTLIFPLPLFLSPFLSL